MTTFIIFLIYVLPLLAVLALCAFISDVLLPRFPRAVDWILKFIERW